MTEQVEAKLNDVIRSAFNLPADSDVSEARQAGIEAWDSLGHVSLMLAIESEFEITIDIADQLQLTSFRAIRDYLEGRGA